MLMLVNFSLLNLILVCHAKVLVIGGTGRVGSAVVRNLLSAGIPTSILSRNADSSKNIEGAEIFQGDVGSMNDLVAASKGCEAIVAVHGVTPPRFSRLTDLIVSPNKDRNHPYKVNYIAMKKIVAVMKTNNVTKLVRITGSFVDKSPFSPFVFLFNLILSRTVKWHQMGEKVIRESNIDYTVIRPPGIRNNSTVPLPRQLVLIPGDTGAIRRQPGQISVEDLATLCALAVSDKRLSNTTVICNTEPITVEEAIRSGGDAHANRWERALRSQSSWRDTKTIVPSRHNLAIATYICLVPIIVHLIGRALAAAARRMWPLIARLRRVEVLKDVLSVGVW